MKKRIIALVLVAGMVLSLGACSTSKISATNLMDNPKIKKEQGKDVTTSKEQKDELNIAATDFSVRLLQNTLASKKEEGKTNTLLSPMSVLIALSMTANGAKEDTLKQMENVLGAPITKLNGYLGNYQSTTAKDADTKLHIANSIWFTDDNRFTVNDEFLQANANSYNADVFKATFDENTLNDINTWVEENTEGMIKNILNEIPEDAIMYLINAVAFDAKWQVPYEIYQVNEGEFTKQDGTKISVDMMHSSEAYYLEDEQAVGFIKHYEGQKYAFVALLPNEGVTVDEYVSSLTGEHLQTMLRSPQEVTVFAEIPKFETEYSVLMQDVLKEMGMVDAFDKEKADFSGLGSYSTGNIWINRVIHKTYMAVDELGTKAGASTVVEVMAEGAFFVEDAKEVYLNRPFVYMIIDCESNVPVFLGTYEGNETAK